ncbi:MAG TPA: hypothetical protein VGI85_13910 [Chthoniobacterales bacterium]
MKSRGYLFALPRLLARLAGYEVCRAELSAWEVYGFGVFVFTMACVVAGWAIWPFVRPGFVILLPIAVWVAFLLLYYVNFLLAQLLRRLGFYTAVTNNPLQHFVIMALMTLLAAWLIVAGNPWLRSLGVFWCALVALNLLALALLKILHAP